MATSSPYQSLNNLQPPQCLLPPMGTRRLGSVSQATQQSQTTVEKPEPQSIQLSSQPTISTGEDSLTMKTSGSLLFPDSFSSFSLQAPTIVRNERERTRCQEHIQRTITRRPRISDLHHHQSAPAIPQRHRDPARSSPLRRPWQWKRSVSADIRLNRNSRFTSPDRYTVSRMNLQDHSSPLRTNLHPSLLETDERLSRHKSDNSSAFRSSSEPKRGRARDKSTSDRLGSFQPPHYTPSFVHTRETEYRPGSTRPEVELSRRSSTGSIWRIGGWSGAADHRHSVELGNGIIIASGSNAPMIDSNFLISNATESQHKKHQERLALALEIDTARRVLPIHDLIVCDRDVVPFKRIQYRWFNGGWARNSSFSAHSTSSPSLLRPQKVVPTIAFRVLDAPRLKDDYYCSVLAYCCPLRTLAVALNHRVYLWTERNGVRYPPLPPARQSDYVTSLAFSSDRGGKAILAITRFSGRLTLWSLFEDTARFDVSHPSTACSVAFRPVVSKRTSSSTCLTVDCEDLLVGDDSGCIHYYSVEWSEHGPGSLCLLAKIEAHSQNVCGLAWAPDGKSFASGGNDNSALLFNRDEVLQRQSQIESARVAQMYSSRSDSLIATSEVQSLPCTRDLQIPVATTFSDTNDRYVQGNRNSTQASGALVPDATIDQGLRGRTPERVPVHQNTALVTPPRSPFATLPASRDHLANPIVPGISHAHRYCFYHSAAVKAIAFASWQPTLLATGGGSNDKQIHFHHTDTGTTLAIINVFAQVTSLVWSLTRREIAATFGYAQPEHETRIAVFAWPSCECVVSIPWERKNNGEIGRALWAIPYPGGPNDAAPERSQGPVGSVPSRQTRHGATLQTDPVQRLDTRPRMPLTPETSPDGRAGQSFDARRGNLTRGEGEIWASRTEEEGSLIVACCDQTVKFFEVWAGKSKGKSRGLGSKAGIFGGSKVLEGWCKDVAIDEVGTGEDVIQ